MKKNAKIMISQPMKGKTNEQIHKEREDLKIAIEASGAELMDTVFDNVDNGTPLSYLAKSIEFLDKADIVWFMPGWDKSRGCRIEFECAKEYGKHMKCITEEELKDIKKTVKEAKEEAKEEATKSIKVVLKGIKDDNDLPEQLKKDLEEMLNDITEKRES